MKELTARLAKECETGDSFDIEKFASLIIKECVDSIETYRIPVGNSAAGEIACEMTYRALTDIRDDIYEKFS